MTLTRDTNSFWYIYYIGTDGKRKRTSTKCTRKTDALRFLQSFKTEKKPKPQRTLLADFKRTFLSYAKVNFSAGTVDLYDNALKKLLSYSGNLSLFTHTPQHWDLYKAKRMQPDEDGNGISPVTVNIELRTLKAAFNTAFRWKLIDSNSFSCQKLCRVEKQSPIFFTKEDFQKMIGSIKEAWLREIVIIAVLTGMRRGEILNLKWSDINMSRKTLTIQAARRSKQRQERNDLFQSMKLPYICFKTGKLQTHQVMCSH
jgi:integrase